MLEPTFKEKFKKSIPTFRRTINREVILPIDQPKLYKKVKKYFQSQGAEFYGDVEADYELFLDLLSKELSTELMIR